MLAGARPGAQGFIVDTRSTQAAKQARMTGGGTESKAAYPGWKRLHRPLEREGAFPPSPKLSPAGLFMDVVGGRVYSRNLEV